jgi:hypothetical protein
VDLLLLHRPTLLHASSALAPPEALAVAREVAWVVTAVAERDSALVTSSSTTSGRALALAELMVMCLASSSRATADAALDYFASVNTVRARPLQRELHPPLSFVHDRLLPNCVHPGAPQVPVAERHPQLCAPLFSTALPHLLRHAQYPPHFTSWDEDEQDEDEFYRFRDQQLTDVLESAYGMMRLEYLAAVMQLSQAAATWQQYEVSLYALRAVHLP